MNAFLKSLFVLVLLFAIYHLVRDVLQISGVENVLTDIFHWPPNAWCGHYCDYISLPLEIGAIFGSLLVLQRNRIGIVGVLTLCFSPLFLFATLFLP